MGDRKIVIIGNEGAGKSTLASELAASLGVPHVEVEKVVSLEVALPQPPKGWVVEGMRRGSLRDHAIPRADTVIWLDISRTVIFTSLFTRAITGRIRSSRIDGMRSQRSLPSDMRTLMRSIRRHGDRRKRYRAMLDRAEQQGARTIRARTRRGARKALKGI